MNYNNRNGINGGVGKCMDIPIDVIDKIKNKQLVEDLFKRWHHRR